MPTSVLLTKLFIPPPRPGMVSRPRLLERLDEGLTAGRKLTLISAPAGFGKTTLVSEWIAQCKRPAAWLSLDEGDSDLTRCLTYLVTSLQTVSPDLGAGALAALQSAQPPPTETILTTLLNEIATLPDHFILVLDDYHVVDSQPVDQALTFLIEHLPPQMHLVIATREDPALPLPRLRARGQLTELRAADLRFTPAEAADFLNRRMGLNLTEADIAALEARTEGWIAGLQLAALSMQGRSDTAGFIRAFTGSHRFVLDYLAGEVLARQPERVRSFLLQTAILDRLCAPLCNAVTQRGDGSEILNILEHNNLFLVPLDDQRQWYRFHHLFADVLQAHLAATQPQQASGLHQRASAWHEHNGFLPEAIRHALAAKDLEHAAGLIELAWPAAEEGSIPPTAWLDWVNSLPDELLRTRPVLSVDYAYALLGRGEMETAAARLLDAEKWLEPSGTTSLEPHPEGDWGMVVVDQEQIKSLPVNIAIGRAYIAQAFGNIPDTVRYARQVLAIPEADPFRRSQASMLLGMSYWAGGDLEAAGHVFSDYTLKLGTAGNIPDAISTTVVLAEIRLGLGRLHEAIRTIEQMLRFVMDQGEPIPPGTADLHRPLGELYLEQGNPDAAAQHLQESKTLGEKAEQPVWRYRWFIAQARLRETQGDLDRALTLLDEAERLFVRTPLPDFQPISAMKARIWVAQGRLAQALEWVREKGLSADDELNYLHEFEHITLARILLAQYQSDRSDTPLQAVMRLLDRLLQAAEEAGRMGSVIEILVLQALAHQAQGSLSPALAALERALTLAAPEGFVRIFVDQGEPVRLMIADFRLRIEKQKGEHQRKLMGYAERLLAAYSQTNVVSGSSIDNHQSKINNLVESLSEREMDVLRLLRSDLSGPEIARELIVSLSTLRTHTQNIYAKLEVNNRRAAVRRAEELDLL